MADKSAETVLREVLEAFKNVPYPGDDRLIVPHCSQCLELQGTFARARRTEEWIEKPLEFFKPTRLNSAYLTEDAYRYFFPLLAAAVVRHSRESDLLNETIIWNFDPFFSGKSAEVPEKRLSAVNKRIAALSQAQRQAIIALFGFFKSAHPEDYLECGSIERASANLREGRVIRPKSVE
ncbi:MAG: hypothetical protein HKL90_10190 [Elusimicrobia bacterium]|nr:hypothetical protein [Elusimicrobiota bacterium]